MKINVLKMIDELRQDILEPIENEQGYIATLAIVQVGKNPASNLYVKSKMAELGKWRIGVIHIELEEYITNYELINVIRKLNADKDINGIIVQLPLPKHIKEQAIINSINPLKNVDGFKQDDDKALFKPCTPLGIMYILENMRDIENKVVCLIGRGKTVGAPLIEMLSKEPCTLICCNSNTTKTQLEQYIKTADIVITAVGKPHLFDNRDLKYGALVIDAGISYVNNKQTGDYLHIDFHHNEIDYTPHLNGVGKMTVAMLAVNTIKAAMLQMKG